MDSLAYHTFFESLIVLWLPEFSLTYNVFFGLLYDLWPPACSLPCYVIPGAGRTFFQSVRGFEGTDFNPSPKAGETAVCIEKK